ncbi:MAG: flavin-containing monooxygenase [Myxococcota bacterium]|nr:NAD(P)/FAD-dependent oxidoreductase [Myxococcota bacterium]
MRSKASPVTDVDVIIIGAGLSGIGAAYRLQTGMPRLRYAVLEATNAIGGTWSLFRYPGIRSDSDVYTFAFPFKPWRGKSSIAAGQEILEYIRATAAEHGIDRHVRFGHRVISADWSSSENRWRVVAEVGSERRELRCRFLYACSGYYSYDKAHAPLFDGADRFRGHIAHPQWWPADLDVTGKRVLVVGSGATAITLIPALAEKAAHVTMLQRSPTYVATLPSRDVVADVLRAVLPLQLAHHLVRIKNVLITLGIYLFCRAYPTAARRWLTDNVRSHLGKSVAVDPHFAPRYAPWDQRLCLAPDADIFVALREGKASVVTDTIARFSETGVVLASGAELEADIVVTATGLELLAVGGVQLRVDGQTTDIPSTLVYKGCMLSGVPNFAWCVGYINASWGLRADLASRYVARLLDFMERYGYVRATPRPGASVETRPVLDLSAGYIQRGGHRLPKQGNEEPWMLRQNYLFDYGTMVFGRIDDGALELGV